MNSTVVLVYKHIVLVYMALIYVAIGTQPILMTVIVMVMMNTVRMTRLRMSWDEIIVESIVEGVFRKIHVKKDLRLYLNEQMALQLNLSSQRKQNLREKGLS